MQKTESGKGLGRLVVGVDGSDSTRAAVLWAAREAARRTTGLYLVHATDTAAASFFASRNDLLQRRRNGREALDAAADLAGRHPGLAVVKNLDDDAPADSLRRAAAQSGTIVIGHRADGFPHHVLGSVAREVLQTATTPVVVVREAAEPEPGSESESESGTGTGEPRPVLAAVRDDSDLGCALTAACEARAHQVPLRLLHVRRADSARPPARLVDRVREEFPEVTVETEEETSRSVPGALVEASRHADLLVVGGRRPAGHLGPLLGRTALKLLQHAHCPVEFLPRHGHGHGTT
ncbi:universal stress protein [Streptomyces sp. Da 82-17]|uniref:universal stress protein n=1 Tax=Streptomyces sp. Da 82-17 TaxID=3377116 RepID=UPI0038D3FD64